MAKSSLRVHTSAHERDVHEESYLCETVTRIPRQYPYLAVSCVIFHIAKSSLFALPHARMLPEDRVSLANPSGVSQVEVDSN